MRNKNEYESAFCCWLDDGGYSYSSVSQSQRLQISDYSVKSFDYIVDTACGSIIVELKGRRFTGSSLENLPNLQNWVTSDDISSLSAWQAAIKTGIAVFVFCYKFDDYFADTDGWDSVEYEGNRYAFLAVKLEDYTKCMRKRSHKWQTVNLLAADFRNYAINLSKLMMGNRL